MARTRLLGAVLAGGEGRRLGGPKAAASVGGVSMVGRAVAVLGEAVDDVVVVSSVRVEGAPAPVIPDRVEGAGPLGGLDAALRHALERGKEGVLLLGCDLPLVTAEILAEVAVALEANPAVAPARATGGIEPLCAAYAVAILPAVERRLGEADRSLHALFREVGGAVLTPMGTADHAMAFLNVNTPDDRRRAEAALAGRGPRGGTSADMQRTRPSPIPTQTS